ncbi:transposase [Kitasatospora sp. NPDC004799]|uniref:transposase n=1 Tax=Kitasatospora sp. NPDC004799 TaxID=3154460 RepID=UPI0033A8B0AF
MSAALLDPATATTRARTSPSPGNLPDSDRDAAARVCPVCGSSATYQTMDGRWGCTSCGSTWA